MGHRLVHCGYVKEVSEYRGLLQASDIVLSTALHEFQGLAVMEAVARNCVPIVPDRLVYPEIYPNYCRYESFPDDPEREALAAASLILKVAKQLNGQGVTSPDLSAFGMDHLAPVYAQAFHAAARGQDSQ